MRSRVATWLFAFLFLGMQHGAQWHAIAHLGDTLAHPHEQGLHVALGDAPCEVCALFAGGSAAIPAANDSGHQPPAEYSVPQHAPLSRAFTPAHYYLSRAPPPVL